jgi:hypothetical protein
MDVHRPALIPSRIDSEKVHSTVTVCRLIATKELVTRRVLGGDIGIDTTGIAVPQVYVRAWERDDIAVNQLRDIYRE